MISYCFSARSFLKLLSRNIQQRARARVAVRHAYMVEAEKRLFAIIVSCERESRSSENRPAWLPGWRSSSGPLRVDKAPTMMTEFRGTGTVLLGVVSHAHHDSRSERADHTSDGHFSRPSSHHRSSLHPSLPRSRERCCICIPISVFFGARRVAIIPYEDRTECACVLSVDVLLRARELDVHVRVDAH